MSLNVTLTRQTQGYEQTIHSCSVYEQHLHFAQHCNLWFITCGMPVTNLVKCVKLVEVKTKFILKSVYYKLIHR